MTFRTYTAAEDYLRRSGKRGIVEHRTYSGNGYSFTEYTVVFC